MTHDMHRPTARLQVVLALLAAGLVVSATRLSAGPEHAGMTRPQQAPAVAAEAAGPRLSVKVGFTCTPAYGFTGNASGSAGGGMPWHLGERQTIGIQAGTVGHPDLCGGGTGIGGAVDPAKARALHLWNVTVQPVHVKGEQIALNIDWKRFDAVPGGGYEARAGDRRTIAVDNGGRQVLDLVFAPADSGSHDTSVLVQVEASLLEDPAVAETRLGYDLWLVDQDPAGRQVTRHMEIAGKHRETIAFRFLPIGWSSDGSPAPDDRRPDIVVELSGTLKGWLLPDGSVQIAVTPSRTVRAADGSGSTGYREKTLTAKPGETIRMDIPPSGPAPVRSHRTSLSLTVRAW
jgi:hypothetical protein